MLKHRNVRVFFIGVISALVACRFVIPFSTWYIAIAIFLWLGVTVYGSSAIRSGFHARAFCSARTTKKVVALTFDDGPSPNTLLILDILRKHSIRATFFCIGKHIELHPEIFERIIADGHIVGNHSYSHSPNFDWYGTERVAAELRRTDALIEKATSGESRYFRPPFGVLNPSIVAALKQTGHEIIGWNVRSMDGISKNKSYILRRVLSGLKPGAIILLHDTRAHTAALLGELISAIVARGFAFVSIDELQNLDA